jgi:hypothetical protein
LSASATGHLTGMFFLIDVVARWFARWDDGVESDRDPLASPDHSAFGTRTWSASDRGARRSVA